MDIGPVSAIRPVSMIRTSPVAPDLSRVGATENRGRSGDDEYTPDDRKPSRGLEEEDDETAAESPAEAARQGASGAVSFFA